MPTLPSLFVLCLCILHVLALQGKTDEPATRLLCSPFGACEPCPPDAMSQPYCLPYGNRRQMHCVNSTVAHMPPPPSSNRDPSNNQETPGAPTHKDAEHLPGEILAWESCGRIVPKERRDFYEFVATNVAFASIALVVLFLRSRRLQAIQARQLAARIGLIRPGR